MKDYKFLGDEFNKMGANFAKILRSSYFTNKELSTNINTSALNKSIKNSNYIGDLKNGEYHGKGVLKLTDGSIYCGEFIDGKMQGKGILILPNGTEYHGKWQNNERDGYGVLFYENGRRTKQLWNKGYLVSEEKISFTQDNVSNTKKCNSFDDIFIKEINCIVKKYGTECFKKGGNASNLLDDLIPGNEYSKQRQRVKIAIESGACNHLIENNCAINERIEVAVIKLIDYIDMDEKIAFETIKLLADVLI